MGNHSPSPTDGHGGHGQGDGFSTRGDQKSKHKSIIDVLNERIQAFVQKPEALTNGSNYSAEFSQLRIENDLVNVFFDEIHKMSDPFTFNFIETLK